MDRRGFLKKTIAATIVAPAIVRAESIMRIKPLLPSQLPGSTIYYVDGSTIMGKGEIWMELGTRHVRDGTSWERAARSVNDLRNVKLGDEIFIANSHIEPIDSKIPIDQVKTQYYFCERSEDDN